MEPEPAGDIEVEIGVVHPVQPPEPGHGMAGDVLEIDGEIKQNQSGQKLDAEGQCHAVEQADGLALGKDCRRVSRRTQRQALHHTSITTRPRLIPSDASDFP